MVSQIHPEVVIPVETITINRIDYDDFEKAVNKFYGKTNYSFPADIECSNDSQHEFKVTDKPLSDYDRKYVEEFKAGGNNCYLAGRLFNDMCINGVIEPGTYLITVCW